MKLDVIMGFILGMSVGAVALSILLHALEADPKHQRKIFFIEAVKNGHAHWNVDTNGDVKFEWNKH
jgi:hypothetical protein